MARLSCMASTSHPELSFPQFMCSFVVLKYTESLPRFDERLTGFGDYRDAYWEQLRFYCCSNVVDSGIVQDLFVVSREFAIALPLSSCSQILL